MILTVLGIGGFRNEGLPFNAYCLDRKVLIDTPPDILQSLAQCGIPLTDLETIVLTHYHGDHYFGLPFLLFNLYMDMQDSMNESKRPAHRLKIFGPPGLQTKLRQILSLAIHPDHAYIAWCFEQCELVEISEGIRYPLDCGIWLEFRHSVHVPETFSLMSGLANQEKPLFTATSDTRWDESLFRLFDSGARLFLCDSNGSGFGNVHMSPEEILVHIIPRLAGNARLLATHISRETTSPDTRLEFASLFTDYYIE